MKLVYALIGSLMLSSAVFAQQAPPPTEGAPPPPQGDDRGPGPRDRGPGRPDGPGMRGGPDGMGRGPGGPMSGEGGEDPRLARFNLMRGYLDAVDRYARLAHDPQLAGIAAVVNAADMLKPRGADVAIDFFTKILPEVKSPAVQRAIRIQLVDLYKAAGKQDQALEQLKTLITAEPSKEEPAMAPPPGGGPPRQ